MPIQCPYCSREFPGDKLSARHLSICNPACKLPVEPCLCGHVATSRTSMTRHQRDCSVWQTRDVDKVRRDRQVKTSLARYGVENANQTEEALAKRAQTSLERYGAENPFSKESSVFEKVQASLEGKRPVFKGADNAFARPEVKEKIRDYWLENHGVTGPQQVPEIREATRQTNLERYGTEEVLAAPEIRKRIQDTCEAVYGGPSPSCSPEVVAKQQETKLAKCEVPWKTEDAETVSTPTILDLFSVSKDPTS